MEDPLPSGVDVGVNFGQNTVGHARNLAKAADSRKSEHNHDWGFLSPTIMR